MWRCCGGRQKSSEIHSDLTQRLLSVPHWGTLTKFLKGLASTAAICRHPILIQDLTYIFYVHLQTGRSGQRVQGEPRSCQWRTGHFDSGGTGLESPSRHRLTWRYSRSFLHSTQDTAGQYPDLLPACINCSSTIILPSTVTQDESPTNSLQIQTIRNVLLEQIFHVSTTDKSQCQ